ncbi:AAA family ATPase [Burkholderia arboris]|uniref:AAA family ATPase n=1 Tax=Burkholderia arboris TaxID=488730 RepID=UPI001CF4AEA4|nr:helicase RepA family protein [Burkholderia arboris]MCA8493576.1 helicase RepA family protein [Burkholderia arboris]
MTNSSWKFATKHFVGYAITPGSPTLDVLQWLEEHIELKPELLDDYRNALVHLPITLPAFCDWSVAHGFSHDEASTYYFDRSDHNTTAINYDPLFDLKNHEVLSTVVPDSIFSLACECGYNLSSPWKSNAEIEQENATKLAAEAETKKALKLASTRYKLRSAADLVSAPPMKWLVRGVLPATGLAVLYGPPGSGKSFLLLDLCAAVASGTPWFGHFVKSPAPVLYAVLEGQGAFGNRLDAWRMAHENAPLPDCLRFLTDRFDLTKPNDVADLCDAVLLNGGDGGLIVLDTLSRAAPGIDENSGADMGKLIAACSAIQQKTNGMVLLVHHTGKTEGKGLRGHSSLLGAVDTAIEISRSRDYREWTIAKSRDSADGERNGFVLKLMTMGSDEFDQPVSSYVVEAIDGPAPAAAKKLPASLQPVKTIFEQLSKDGSAVRFGDLCEAVKASFAKHGKEKAFIKWNIRRDYAKYFGGNKPEDDSLVSF